MKTILILALTVCITTNAETSPEEILIKKFNKCPENNYFDIFDATCNHCSPCNKNEFVVQGCSVFDDTICSTCADRTYANTFAHRSNCQMKDSIKYVDGVVKLFPVFDPARVSIVKKNSLKSINIPDENSIVIDKPTNAEMRWLDWESDDLESEYDSEEDDSLGFNGLHKVNINENEESLVPMSHVEAENDGTLINNLKVVDSQTPEKKEDSNSIIVNDDQNDYMENGYVASEDSDDDSSEPIGEISSVAVKINSKYQGLLEREKSMQKSSEINDVVDVIRNFPYENSFDDSDSDENSDEDMKDVSFEAININKQNDDTEFGNSSNYSNHTRFVVILLYLLGAFVILTGFCYVRRSRTKTYTYVFTPPLMTPTDQKDIISAFDHITNSRRGQFKYQQIGEFV